MSPFPILRLPSKELSKILRQMDPISQLVFSLLSEKSKNQISLLRIFSGTISINVCAYKRKEKLTLRFRYSTSSLEVHKCGPNLVIDLQNGRDITSLSFRREMSLRQWIDHFMELTATKRLDELTLSSIKKKHKYDLKGFYRSLAGLHIREFFYCGPNIRLFGTLPIVHKIIFLDCKNTLTPGFRQILVQNPNRVSYFNQTVTRIKLNDLLVSNASFLHSMTTNLPDAQLNLFLKHWIAGSNQSLHGITLIKSREGESYNKDVVMKGIDYHPAEEREIPNSMRGTDFCPMFNTGVVTKFGITSSDGVQATIYFRKTYKARHRPDGNDDDFCMLVWK